ncbi:MAG: DUF4097 family beta strand repeat-containing protein [Clostridia bacterium]
MYWKRTLLFILSAIMLIAVTGCKINIDIDVKATPEPGFSLIKASDITDDFNSFKLDWKTGGLLYSLYSGDAKNNIVQIRRSESGKVRIEQYAKMGFKDESAFSADVEDGVLIIKDARASSIYDETQHPSFFIMYLPEKLFRNVDIELANCTFSGLDLKAGDISFKLGSGSAVLKGEFKNELVDIATGALVIENSAEESENVKLYMASGSFTSTFKKADIIDAKILTGDLNMKGDAKDVKFDLAAGAIDYKGSAGNMKMDVASGKVTSVGSVSGALNVGLISGAVSITSSTMIVSADATVTAGNLQLSLPRNNSGFKVYVDRAAGTFSSGFATTKTDNEYLFGDGGVKITLKLISGSIKISPV